MATRKAAPHSCQLTSIRDTASTNGRNNPLIGRLSPCVSVGMSTTIVNISTTKEYHMSALPVYDVEFIPLERRLGARRVAPRDAALPPQIMADRRKTSSRRAEDRKPTNQKANKTNDKAQKTPRHICPGY